MAALPELYYGICGEPIIHITNQKTEKRDDGLYLIFDLWRDPTFDRIAQEAAVYSLRGINLRACEAA